MGAITVLKDAALEMKQTAYGVGQEWGGGVAGQGGRAGSCSGCQRQIRHHPFILPTTAAVLICFLKQNYLVK